MMDLNISETINNQSLIHHQYRGSGWQRKNDILYVQIIKTSYFKREKLLSLDKVDSWIDSDGSQNMIAPSESNFEIIISLIGRFQKR
jgi:hypothetical protein